MFVTYTAVFGCLFAVTTSRNFISNEISSAWTINDSGCITPLNQAGDCLDVEDCPPIADFLNSLDRRGISMSSHQKEVYVKYICQLGRRMKVCCPRGYHKDMPVMMRHVVPEEDCGDYDETNRIAGGNQTALFEFPWMAYLVYENEYNCAGSLINDRYVLTAAHCLVGKLRDQLLHVRLGEYDLKNDIDCEKYPEGDVVCADRVQDITVEEIIIHPDFNQSAFRSDIALLRLSKRAILSASVRPICLPVSQASREAVIQKMVLTGWGQYYQISDKSDILQKVELPVVDQQACQKFYKNTPINENHICVGDGTTRNSCSGDSGGPVQMVATIKDRVRYVQYGIVSLGPGWNSCNVTTILGVHTKVVPFMPWIIKNIRV